MILLIIHGMRNASPQPFILSGCRVPIYLHPCLAIPLSLPAFTQAQLLLADQKWPPGLFPGDDDCNEKPPKPHRGSSTGIWNLDSKDSGDESRGGLGIHLEPLMHLIPSSEVRYICLTILGGSGIGLVDWLTLARGR